MKAFLYLMVGLILLLGISTCGEDNSVHLGDSGTNFQEGSVSEDEEDLYQSIDAIQYLLMVQ